MAHTQTFYRWHNGKVIAVEGTVGPASVRIGGHIYPLTSRLVGYEQLDLAHIGKPHCRTYFTPLDCAKAQKEFAAKELDKAHQSVRTYEAMLADAVDAINIYSKQQADEVSAELAILPRHLKGA